MSKDYYLGTVIGLRVESDQLFERKETFISLCKCDRKIDTDYADTLGYKFCPRCSRDLKSKSVELVPKIEGIIFSKDPWNWEKNHIRGWNIYADTPCNRGSIYYYIGILIRESVMWWGLVARGDGFTKLNEVREALEKIQSFRADMRKVGLWNRKKFGLWTVMKWK